MRFFILLLLICPCWINAIRDLVWHARSVLFPLRFFFYIFFLRANIAEEVFLLPQQIFEFSSWVDLWNYFLLYFIFIRSTLKTFLIRKKMNSWNFVFLLNFMKKGFNNIILIFNPLIYPTIFYVQSLKLLKSSMYNFIIENNCTIVVIVFSSVLRFQMRLD